MINLSAPVEEADFADLSTSLLLRAPVAGGKASDPFERHRRATESIRLTLSPGSTILGTVAPKIPLGIDDFREIRSGGFAFVDKSLFVRQVLDNSAKVVCCRVRAGLARR